MQTQAADTFCLQVRLGKVGLISMPADNVPRRVDWGHWIDCVSVGSKISKNRIESEPRVILSPDHPESKDNISIVSLQGRNGLEDVDPLRMITDIVEATKFLFVGTWNRPTPSWFSSIQAVFAAKYAGISSQVLADQSKYWGFCAERLEKSGSFLVNDDVGRLSALTAISKSWRSRIARSALSNEARGLSWVAATVDIHSPVSAEGVKLRIHRTAVIEPEEWCGAPEINPEIIERIRFTADCPEVWISSPGLGLSLWIADQQESLKTCQHRLRMPGAILGWHPLRDVLSFLAEAPSQSVLYMVDRHSRLQVIKKELDDSK